MMFLCYNLGILKDFFESQWRINCLSFKDCIRKPFVVGLFSTIPRGNKGTVMSNDCYWFPSFFHSSIIVSLLLYFEHGKQLFCCTRTNKQAYCAFISMLYFSLSNWLNMERIWVQFFLELRRTFLSFCNV